MPFPTPYSRTFSFTGAQSGRPLAPLPGPKLDIELDEIANASAIMAAALVDIRRADGALVDGLVTLDSLSPAVQTLIGASAGLASGVTYAALVPGLKFDGVTDIAAGLNALMAQVGASGGGLIILPPSPFVADTLVPVAGVRLQGASRIATVHLSRSLTCWAQAPGTQIVGFGLTEMKIRPYSTDYVGATVFTITAMQASEIGNLYVTGFTAGRLLNVDSSLAATLVDPELGSNGFHNSVHDIMCYPQIANGIRVSGKYSGDPGSYPAIVNTLWNFTNIFLWRVTGVGIDAVRCTDTMLAYNIVIAFGANGAIGLRHASDDDFPDGNVYVNNWTFFGLTFADASKGFTTDPAVGLTSCTLFAGNWSYGLEVFGFKCDIDTVTHADNVVIAMLKSQSHRVVGQYQGPPSNLWLQDTKEGFNWDSYENGVPLTEGQVFVSPQGVIDTIFSGSDALNVVSIRVPARPPPRTVCTWVFPDRPVAALTMLTSLLEATSVYYGVTNPQAMPKGGFARLRYLPAPTGTPSSWVPA